MLGIMQSEAEAVGAEIREVRKARLLTLKDLSERTGKSVAYLSRVELGTANVSPELLADIGDALQVDPSWFYPDRPGAGPLEQAAVVRQANRRPLSGMYTRTEQELGFSDELLSSTLSGSCYLLQSRFAPGETAVPTPQPGYEFDGEQHGVVISGRIELALGDETIALETGDSFSYRSEIPHRFRNIGRTEATMVWAMTPVRITW